MQNILIRVIIVIIIIFVVQIVISKLRQEKRFGCKTNKEAVVYFSNVYLVIGIVCTLVFTFAIIFMTLYPNRTAAVWIYLIFLFFSIVGIYLILLSSVWKIFLFEDSDYLIYISIFGIKHKIFYNDILYYKYAKQFTHLKTKTRLFFVDNDANNVDRLLYMLESNKVNKLRK